MRARAKTANPPNIVPRMRPIETPSDCDDPEVGFTPPDGSGPEVKYFTAVTVVAWPLGRVLILVSVVAE